MICTTTSRRDESLSQEYSKMDKPQRIESYQPQNAPLYGNIECLVVWIRNDFRRGARPADRILLEQPVDRPRAVTEYGRFPEEADRFVPEFESFADCVGQRKSAWAPAMRRHPSFLLGGAIGSTGL